MIEDSMDDLQLLARWRDERDADAFRGIVARHAAMVHATCRRVLGNAEDAREISQECFLRLAEERARVRSSLGGFLHHLALSLARHRLESESRRRRRERRVAREELPAVASGADPTWDEVQLHIDEAIDALPTETREIIVGRYLEQETLEAIASRLGLSRRQAGLRAEKGIEAIRRHLRRHGIGLGTALLAALLSGNAVVAAPAELVAALGRRALAGEVRLALSPTAIGSIGSIGGVIVVKKLLVTVAAAALVALGLWSIPRNTSNGPDLPTAAPVASTAGAETSEEAAPAAATPATARVEVEVRWAHSGAAAREAVVSMRGPGDGEAGSAPPDAGGRAAIDIPAAWRAVQLRVEHPGADNVERELVLPLDRVAHVTLHAIHSLTGRVTRRGSGAAIAGAELVEKVFPERPDFDVATTDARGEYELFLPGRGRHEIRIRADGYADHLATVEITERGASALDVALEPAIEVLVRVRSEEGAPLEGARVTPSSSSTRMYGGYNHADSVFTDATGETIVPRICRRQPQAMMVALDGYSTQYFEFDPVSDGLERIERTVVLVREVGTEQAIEGFVTDETGVGLEGVSIRWRYSTTIGFGPGGIERAGETTVTDVRGHYRFDVFDEDDECVLAFAAPGRAPAWRIGVRSGPRASPGRCDVTLLPAHWLDGVVVDEDGAPVADVRIAAAPPLCDESAYPEIARAALTDAAGRFSLRDLPPPPLGLEVEPPKGSGLAWREPPAITTNQEIEIVLCGGGEIRGRVVDAASGAVVPVFSAQRSFAGRGFWEDKQKIAFTADDGRFVLPEVPRAHEWALRVDAEGYVTAEVSPIAVFRDGEEGETTIALRRAMPLRGIVTDAESGAGLAGVTVVSLVWPYDGPIGWSSWDEFHWRSLLRFQRMETDAEGAFEGVEDPDGVVLIRHGRYRPVLLTPEERSGLIGGDGRLRVALVRGESIACTWDPPPGVADEVGVSLYRPVAGVDEEGFPKMEHFEHRQADRTAGFGWEGLRPGRYEIEFRLLGPDAVRDLRYRTPVELVGGEPTRVALGAGLGSLTFTGRLLDPSGHPHHAISVILRPKFEWVCSELSCYVSAHEDARFRFEHLAPGTYAVEARAWRRGRFPLPDITIAADLAEDLELEIP